MIDRPMCAPPLRMCQSFRVNGFGFVVDVGVVFGVDVGVVFGSVVVVFGDGLQGKGAVPLPLRPRRKELSCIMPTHLVWTFVPATAR